MPMLVAIAIGFFAIIVVGTAAAWVYDGLEARWQGLTDGARRVRRGAATTTRYAVRSGREHGRRAPMHAYAVGARRVPMHAGPRDRLLRS